MKLTNKMLLLAILATTLAACGKKDEPAVPAPTAAPAATAPVATAPAEPTMAPPPAEPAMSAPPVASDGAMMAATPAGELPAACEAYLKRAAACYEKVAASNPAAVEQMRSSLDQTRTQWLAVPDKSQLGTACTMADTQFAQSVAMLKCE